MRNIETHMGAIMDRHMSCHMRHERHLWCRQPLLNVLVENNRLNLCLCLAGCSRGVAHIYCDLNS